MANYLNNLAVILEGNCEPANEFEVIENSDELPEEVDKKSEAWQSRIWWGRTPMEEQQKFWEGIMKKLRGWSEFSQNHKWALEDAENILRTQGILNLYFEEDYRFYEKSDFLENPELANKINKCRKLLMIMFGAFSLAENKVGQLILQQRNSGFWNKRLKEFMEFGENKPDKVDL
jgi:hypothetical protein